jgi:hypothetical protein
MGSRVGGSVQEVREAAEKTNEENLQKAAESIEEDRESPEESRSQSKSPPLEVLSALSPNF